MISTRGRYALRVMADMAEHGQGGYIRLDEIALRQGISEKYLEGILAALSREGRLEGHRGKGGGYKLTRPPEAYKIGEILRVTEGSLAPVACLKEGAPACALREKCRTLPLWEELYGVICEYFDGKTLADILPKGDERRFGSGQALPLEAIKREHRP